MSADVACNVEVILWSSYTVISQWYSAGLRAGLLVFRVPLWARNFSPYHHVQTGSGAHPPSYTMGIGDSFTEGKAAGT
jgi:hypothetical protein